MSDLPVVVIGAGPSGLAAAAQLRSRDMPAIVLESGSAAGSAVREWSHIRLFSPWRELVDPASATLLSEAGWTSPDADAFPTGAEWARDYLEPLAETLGNVRFNARVTGVAKRGRDLMVDSGRDTEPLTVHVTTEAGDERIEARAVIDASGTWSGVNPLGSDGLPALGEAANADRIVYRVPDLNDAATRHRYAGKHVAVAGTGASAKTALIGLTRIAAAHPGTRVSWLVRRSTTQSAFGGGDDDQLVRRGELGKEAQAAVTTGSVTTFTGFRTASVEGADGRLAITSYDGQVVRDVDEVIVLTGFRPDLSMLTEVRLDLDPVLEAPSKLAPLIDPNVHSCGTVEPHGAKVLAQPESGFYLVGMKSYGRAPSFLTLTGYEQVRSVVAALAGDHAAAERVDLVLPETGVCGGLGDFGDGSACCSPSIATAPELLTIGGVAIEVTPTASLTPPGVLDRAAMRRVVWSLCLTETVSYGVLYYAFLVLNTSIVADTGWSATATMLAFSVGQVVAAVGGIAVGRLIDSRGPRAVMTGGSVIAAPALCMIALSPNLAVFIAGWTAAGVAMSAVLYTPAFSAISHWGGAAALRGLTAVTLMAGFASTIFGPLSARLEHAFGWREAFVMLAVALAALTIPAHWFGLRGEWAPRSHEPDSDDAEDAGLEPDIALPFVMLAVAMSLAVLAEYGVLVQLVPLLVERGLDTSSAAVVLGVGGAGQVAGRVFYANLAARTGLVRRTSGLLILLAVTTVLFVVAPTRIDVLLAVTTLAGAVRGCVTLLLATAVPDRWGVFAIGRRNGLLSAPVMVSGALAPFVTAVLSDWTNQATVFYALAATAAVAAAVVPFTVPRRASVR